jgi:hypothetical protein
MFFRPRKPVNEVVGITEPVREPTLAFVNIAWV